MATIVGAAAIGLALGLLGSGGSILTVPILLYGLGHEEKAAIAESLAIVGVIAALGAVPFQRAGDIAWRAVAFFGAPGLAGTYGGAWLAQYVPSAVQLVLFAVVMLLAAGLMFRRTTVRTAPAKPHPVWKIVAEGFSVGVLTGLVGVGGGFLVVPALALLGGLPMRQAVGSSLVVVALKSFVGFYKYLHVLDALGGAVDWRSIAWFSAIGALGTLVGSAVGNRLPQAVLRRAFAFFLVVMSVYVLARELPKVMPVFKTQPGKFAGI